MENKRKKENFSNIFIDKPFLKILNGHRNLHRHLSEHGRSFPKNRVEHFLHTIKIKRQGLNENETQENSFPLRSVDWRNSNGSQLKGSVEKKRVKLGAERDGRQLREDSNLNVKLVKLLMDMKLRYL